ncbi:MULTISPECIES: autotransporter outer membrane beta-barrel domain-containing protein [Paraburkholderia]|uniref:Autotransporter outer membrane beta-barrel domain-containing protein n=1 Tax=Paraburkholderia metrosideri TaxID=580937 RepID=A0ABW9DLN7_9BURK
MLPLPVYANCTTTGNATSCDTSPPTPWASTIGTGPTAPSGASVTVGPNAQVVVGDASAIALGDNANITVQSGALVQNSARTTGGTYGTGGNTIDFRNNSTLTVQQGATVISAGTQGSAEAVNPEGSGNTIINNGTIRGVNSAAIWFQNTSGLNTVINNATGIIQAPGNVIGASGNGSVDFTNRGQVIGNLIFAGGNDTLRFYTGSSISGNFDGGGGTNTIYLSGTGTATLPGNMVNFSSLIKNDPGFWTLTGTITGVTVADVQEGTLALTGNNTNYTGKVIVEPNGTLQVRAQSLPPAVTDNGLVRFLQPDNGTYAGLITGTGAVEKTGAGTLTLAPMAAGGNTYSGGTLLNQGIVAASADNVLGAATGGLTFNGGTLQLAQSFDLAGTRAVTLNAGGGTIDTQGFTSTLVQGSTGAGALTKAGSGMLTLTSENTYIGGTTIAAGTLQLGNGGTSGSIAGDVTDNGSLVFNRSDVSAFGGTVSGTGSVTQAGSGATVFGANNTYSGGTTISAGTLQLGAGGTTGSIVGDVSDNGVLVFNRSDSITFPGTISGTGTVTQAGSGTTILTADNPYSGGTNVAAGALAVGDAAHTNAALSGGGPITVASGATLGGYGSVTGNVTNNGTIAVANALAQFSGEANGSFTINGSLVNAGLAQIGGGPSVGNTLAVNSYIGQNGTLGLNTYLGVDGSASDKLVINGGTATGTSALKITNVGGPGAQTLSNGIQVIQSTNGATSETTAFTLAAPAKAGAYEYYLAKGGVTSGTANNWYLRNTVAPQPAEVVTRPGSPPSPAQDVPIAAVGTPPLPAAPAAGSDPIPLYRPEVPVYAEIPTVARQLGIMQVDTFHDRQGDQSLLTEDGKVPTAWGRVWGGHSVMSQSGDVNPQFDGSVMGVQAGHDIYADTSASGHQNHYGFFVGFARATGDVSGFALGTPNFDAGHLAVNAYSLGGYWTHTGPGGWYTDAVLMGSSLVVDPSSRDGVNTTTHGNAVTGSVEGGLPIPLGYNLTLEPQAQLIWQHLSINDLNDGISNVTFNNGNTFLGRIGVRLAGKYDAVGTTWQPYLRLSLLRSFGSDDKVTFGGVTPIGTSIGQTAGQIGAGVVAKFTKQGSAFATVSYVTNLGGEHQRTVTGNAGVRWGW